MTTKNLFTMLMLAGLTTASLNTTASAQGFGRLQGRFSKITAQKITAQKIQIPTKVYVPTLTTNGSGGVSFSRPAH